MKACQFFGALWALGVGWTCAAQPSTSAPPHWRYSLVGPSTLVVDCPLCGRPTIPEALRGGFDMRLMTSNFQGQVWAVENLAFYTGDPQYPTRRLTGGGQWRLLTPTAEPPKQQMTLELEIIVEGTPPTTFTLDFTNDFANLPKTFPVLNISLTDTRGSPAEVYHLALLAVPAREIWFSTRHNFTGAQGINGTRGDLLSASGRIVRRYGDLIGRLGLMPMIGEYNVDAVDLGPKGDVQFSLGEDVFSETQGPMYHGDLLSSKGHVVKTYSQWLAPFTPMPPTPNAGLDAVARLPEGGRVFSVRDGFFSQSLGRFIRSGDLLTEEGQVYRSIEQLMAFYKTTAPDEVGLDAVYVWPHGEIWFSTENRFDDEVLGPIQEGDLLSSWGYVVFRNLDLLAPFEPLEDLADFGLDALHVITDERTPPAVPPRLLDIRWSRSEGTLSFEWDGDGQVFQLEWAPSLNGPWQPLRPPEPEVGATFSLPPQMPPIQFFRLRQW